MAILFSQIEGTLGLALSQVVGNKCLLRRRRERPGEAMAVPGSAGGDADGLLRGQRLPEEQPAPSGLQRRPRVPPHHIRLPQRSHRWAHHVRHGLVHLRCSTLLHLPVCTLMI